MIRNTLSFRGAGDSSRAGKRYIPMGRDEARRTASFAGIRAGLFCEDGDSHHKTDMQTANDEGLLIAYRPLPDSLRADSRVSLRRSESPGDFRFGYRDGPELRALEEEIASPMR